jgi:hypothetical protein
MPGEATRAVAAEQREPVRRAFEDPPEFTSSPLYRALSRTVAAEDRLLDLASRGRPGQYPTFLFFGAVQYLLLSGIEHPLAVFYPSIATGGAPPTAGGAEAVVAPGPALMAFCEQYEHELTEVISTRLVQTNQVQRALGLRLGLSAIARDVPGPVHVIEVGASAGFNLRFDRYGYTVGGRRFGDSASPVQLIADHYGSGALPDLDALPSIASVVGVDLNPIDVLDPDGRRWLEALVWPENHYQRALLAAALDLTATDPPPIHRGDAIDVLPLIAPTLPAGEPRVVFHSATRIHVPADRLEAFDAAIASLGQDGPLWWLSVEEAPDPDPRPDPTRYGAALQLRAPDGERRTLAVVEGHLRWVETITAR